MIHQLKCTEEYFKSLASGEKTFEVRENDRNYIVDDFLALNEFSDTLHIETGRCLLFKITYVLDGNEFCKQGMVILGICPCAVIPSRSGRSFLLD